MSKRKRRRDGHRVTQERVDEVRNTYAGPPPFLQQFTLRYGSLVKHRQSGHVGRFIGPLTDDNAMIQDANRNLYAWPFKAFRPHS